MFEDLSPDLLTRIPDIKQSDMFAFQENVVAAHYPGQQAMDLVEQDLESSQKTPFSSSAFYFDYHTAMMAHFNSMVEFANQNSNWAFKDKEENLAPDRIAVTDRYLMINEAWVYALRAGISKPNIRLLPDTLLQILKNPGNQNYIDEQKKLVRFLPLYNYVNSSQVWKLDRENPLAQNPESMVRATTLNHAFAHFPPILYMKEMFQTPQTTLWDPYNPGPSAGRLVLHYGQQAGQMMIALSQTASRLGRQVYYSDVLGVPTRTPITGQPPYSIAVNWSNVGLPQYNSRLMYDQLMDPGLGWIDDLSQDASRDDFFNDMQFDRSKIGFPADYRFRRFPAGSHIDTYRLQVEAGKSDERFLATGGSSVDFTIKHYIKTPEDLLIDLIGGRDRWIQYWILGGALPIWMPEHNDLVYMAEGWNNPLSRSIDRLPGVGTELMYPNSMDWHSNFWMEFLTAFIGLAAETAGVILALHSGAKLGSILWPIASNLAESQLKPLLKELPLAAEMSFDFAFSCVSNYYRKQGSSNENLKVAQSLMKIGEFGIGETLRERSKNESLVLQMNEVLDKNDAKTKTILENIALCVDPRFRDNIMGLAPGYQKQGPVQMQTAVPYADGLALETRVRGTFDAQATMNRQGITLPGASEKVAEGAVEGEGKTLTYLALGIGALALYNSFKK